MPKKILYLEDNINFLFLDIEQKIFDNIIRRLKIGRLLFKQIYDILAFFLSILVSYFRSAFRVTHNRIFLKCA